ncbi:MAG: ATP-binding cassette domain-containing protein, partial [Devosia sp.]
MSALIAADRLRRDYEVTRGLFARPYLLRAVADATFSVEEGTTLAIVGESGCGKSTLLFGMTQLLSPPGEVTGGSVVFRGQDMV